MREAYISMSQRPKDWSYYFTISFLTHHIQLITIFYHCYYLNIITAQEISLAPARTAKSLLVSASPCLPQTYDTEPPKFCKTTTSASCSLAQNSQSGLLWWWCSNSLNSRIYNHIFSFQLPSLSLYCRVSPFPTEPLLSSLKHAMSISFPCLY